MGVGQVGYGPRRFRDIIDSTGGDFNEMLRRAADASADDVISGYAMFYGGEDPKTRARPNATPWTRIAGLGPAFFTKFLYFTTPGALILDNVLARKVHELSGILSLPSWRPVIRLESLPICRIPALDVAECRDVELHARRARTHAVLAGPQSD